MVIYKLLQKVDLLSEFAQLALNVVLKLDAKITKPEVLMLMAVDVLHRKSHLKETLPVLRESYSTALEVGNLPFAAHSGYYYCLHSFLCGHPLNVLEQDASTYYNVSLQLNQLLSANCCRIYWQANRYSMESRNHLSAIGASISQPIFYFYDSLTALAIFSKSIGHESEILERVSQNQTKLQFWSDNAPMNHQHKVDLIEAEKCRVLAQKAEAIDLYDKAISGAKANEYIQEEALANELAAKFYLDWGRQRIAGDYMIEAYYGYARWGAKAKVADLEIRYPQLLAPILQQTRSPFSTNETIFTWESVTSASSATSSSSVSVALDLATILKASQIISGEIELEKLLSSLLSIVIENAGADKCVLMLLQEERLLIKGSITEGSEPVVLQRLPIEDSQDIPLKLIYKVKHDRQTVVLLNATTDRTLANDPYIIRQQPKSILCSPILHQGKLLGILYLENNLVTGAFTSDRVELINLLCAQAAISLENARLYEQSQTYSQQLEQALREQQKLAAVVQSSSDFIGIATLTGQAIYLNPAGRQLVGLDSAAEISNFQMRDFHTPEDFDRIEQEILPRMMQQGVGHGEMNFRHFQTGQLIPTDYVLFVIKDYLTNQPLCLASISRDISDRTSNCRGKTWR